MSRTREAIIMGIGILTGITLCGPAAQAATNLTATLSSQSIYVDDRQVSMTAYAINGNNYVKLRDVAEAVDFNAYWDGKAVRIESDRPYTGEAPAGQTSQHKLAEYGRWLSRQRQARHGGKCTGDASANRERVAQRYRLGYAQYPWNVQK